MMLNLNSKSVQIYLTHSALDIISDEKKSTEYDISEEENASNC